jgi:NADH dehydrogenase
MSSPSVTVFGGTGFLGRRVVARLADAGAVVRVASRHPGAPGERVVPVTADITDRDSVARALDGADAAVNCVSLYVESRTATFRDIHVVGAGNLATAARGLRLLHLSGIGADPRSPSPYVRARGLGEEAVRAAHPRATILRPCVMFGPDDAFLNALDRIAALTPVIPLFGSGGTKLQPVHVEDVAAAAVRAIEMPDTAARIFELGGPQILTYRQIVERVLAWKKRRRLLLPLPFAIWDLLAWCGGWLPLAPVTEGQVALMKRDNVVSEAMPGFAEFGVTPQSLDAVLRS